MNEEPTTITEADFAQARELAAMFGGNGLTNAHQLQIVAEVVARLRTKRQRMEQALEIVHELVREELRAERYGHDAMMLSLEAIARQGRGLPADDTQEYLLNPKAPQHQSKLATLLSDTYLALVVAGRWNACEVVKAERDAARRATQ